MDGLSQATNNAALVSCAATWLRDEEATLQVGCLAVTQQHYQPGSLLPGAGLVPPDCGISRIVTVCVAPVLCSL
jgi:hypothetical protein